MVPPRLLDFILTPYLTTPKWTQLEYLKEHWIRDSIRRSALYQSELDRMLEAKSEETIPCYIGPVKPMN
jgi:hypothetical protein